ncbi:MAG: TIGR03086 family metal-binding protein [Sciscionella sp.]
MSEIADRYRRRAAGFTARVEAVADDRWSRPSPCEGWTARDVVQHMTDGAATFLRRVDREIPAASSPAALWAATRDMVQVALDDPTVASTEYDTPMGRMSFEQGVDQFVSFDTLIHTWDLARATGGDERLDPDDVHAAFEASQPLDAMLRSPGVCGPKLDPPPGADEQTRLLAFLGRTA